MLCARCGGTNQGAETVKTSAGRGANLQLKPMPWWLDDGEEVCEHCLQRYAYEVEVRCVACDAALCPHCAVVVRATRESYCPGCEEA